MDIKKGQAMKIRYATISKEGRRSNNEDFFVVMDQQERGRFWGIVCDGMGGHACGEVASETVAHAVSAYWEQHAEERDSEAKVVEACQEATRAIEQKAREVGQAEMGATMDTGTTMKPGATMEPGKMKEMGTTMVMASIEGDIVTIAHVGDSRCYLQRPGQGGVSDAGPREVEFWVRDRGAQLLQQSSGGGDCRRGADSCLSGRPDFALLRWGSQEYGARGLGGKDDGREVAGGDTAWFRP